MKTFFILIIFLLFPIQIVSQTTLYIDNNFGSDNYNGLSPTFSGSNGPKKTITNAILHSAEGDTLVIIATTRSYGTVTFEPDTIEVTKNLTFKTMGGSPGISSIFRINSLSEGPVVTFQNPLNLLGGLILQRGNVAGASNLTVYVRLYFFCYNPYGSTKNSILDSQLLFSGSVSFTYIPADTGSTVITRYELPSTSNSTNLANLIINCTTASGTLTTLTFNETKNIKGEFYITGTGNLESQLSIEGHEVNVSGITTFNSLNSKCKIVLNGCSIYCRASDVAFKNMSGYNSLNNGRVVLAGAFSQRFLSGGTGVKFGDIEINVANSIGTPQNVLVGDSCMFAGRVFLKKGKILSAGKIIFNGDPFPSIIIDEATFDAKPVFLSYVNLEYIGGDKNTSYEYPSGVDKLWDLTIATTKGTSKSGYGIITATNSPIVNGNLKINDNQTLFIKEGKRLVLKGDSAVINGYLVNGAAPDFTALENCIVLKSGRETDIVIKNTICDVLVDSGTVATINITGATTAIENNFLGDDNRWGGTNNNTDFDLTNYSPLNSTNMNLFNLSFEANSNSDLTQQNAASLNKLNGKFILKSGAQINLVESETNKKLVCENLLVNQDGGDTTTFGISINLLVDSLKTYGGNLTLSGHNFTVYKDAIINEKTQINGTGNLIFKPVSSTVPLKLRLHSDSSGVQSDVIRINVPVIIDGSNNYLQIRQSNDSEKLVFANTLELTGSNSTNNHGLDIDDEGLSVYATGRYVRIRKNSMITTNGNNTGILSLGFVDWDNPGWLNNFARLKTFENYSINRWAEEGEQELFVEKDLNFPGLRIVGNIKVTSPQNNVDLTVNNLIHDAGNINIGVGDLIVKDSFKRLDGSYNNSIGWLILGEGGIGSDEFEFNQGVTDFVINNLRFDQNARESINLDNGMDTVQTGVLTVAKNLVLNGNVQIRHVEDTGNKTILAIADGVHILHYAGDFFFDNDDDEIYETDISPVFRGSFSLETRYEQNHMIPASLWPAENVMMAQLKIDNADGIKSSVPGDRTIGSEIILLDGILDAGEYSLTIDAESIKVRSSFDGTNAASVFLTKPVNVVYEIRGDDIPGESENCTKYDPTDNFVFINEMNNLTITTWQINGDFGDQGIIKFDYPVTVRGDLKIFNALELNSSLNLEGNLVIGSDSFLTGAKGKAYFNGTLVFNGTGKDQVITLSESVVHMGNITINKESGNVSLVGGSLDLRKDYSDQCNQAENNIITFIKGLLLTGENRIILDVPVGNINLGFLHIPAAGNISHVVGSVSADPKRSSDGIYTRTEWPIGTTEFYRPVATHMNYETGSRSLGQLVTVSHSKNKPAGTKGLPIIHNDAHITYFPEFYWNIKCEDYDPRVTFILELKGAGYFDYNDIEAMTIIRRNGKANDLQNTWQLQGNEYNNFTLNGAPCLVSINSQGGLSEEGFIFTFGMPRRLYGIRQLEDLIIGIGENESVTIDLNTIFGGNQGELNYVVETIDNFGILTPISVSPENIFKIEGNAEGDATISITATDINDDNLTVSFKVIVDSDVALESDKIPTEYTLLQNYPNPFNPSTNIRFGLPEKSDVALRIFNFLGEEVTTLVDNKELNPGYHTYNFNAENLSSGIYFYTIDAHNYREVRKMILIK